MPRPATLRARPMRLRRQKGERQFDLPVDPLTLAIESNMLPKSFRHSRSVHSREQEARVEIWEEEPSAEEECREVFVSFSRREEAFLSGEREGEEGRPASIYVLHDDYDFHVSTNEEDLQ